MDRVVDGLKTDLADPSDDILNVSIKLQHQSHAFYSSVVYSVHDCTL